MANTKGAVEKSLLEYHTLAGLACQFANGASGVGYMPTRNCAGCSFNGRCVPVLRGFCTARPGTAVPAMVPGTGSRFLLLYPPARRIFSANKWGLHGKYRRRGLRLLGPKPHQVYGQGRPERVIWATLPVIVRLPTACVCVLAADLRAAICSCLATRTRRP